MTMRTAKLLWMFLGLTPIAEAVSSGADRTAIAAGVIYLLGALALHRAGQRDPHGSVLRGFAGTRIASMAAIGGILAVQLVAGFVSGRSVLVAVMGLGLGLFVLWARSRTERELTARVGALLLLSTTLATLGILGEVSMIVLEPYLFKEFYEYDPDLGFRVRPYHPVDGGVTNKYGFNDRDYPERKADGISRILVVGDSFGWAGGREGNYTALLERRLEDHYGGHRVDVINSGYPATHTVQQLAMLKKYGLRYDPDLVILGFFAGNDFIDAHPDRKRIIVNDTHININPLYEYRFLGYPLIPGSRLLLFLQQKWKVAAELWKAEAERQANPRPGPESSPCPGGDAPRDGSRPGDAPRPTPAPGDCPPRAGSPRDDGPDPGRDRRQSRPLPEEKQGFMSEVSFLITERDRLEFFNVGPLRNDRFQRSVNYILKSIEEMNELLKRRNIKFIVAIYPDEFQVNKALLKKVFSRFKLSEGDYDLRLAQDILKRFLDSKKIPYIDMTDRFVREADKSNLYLLRDTHWNRAGNELASDILFQYLIPHLDGQAPRR